MYIATFRRIAVPRSIVEVTLLRIGKRVLLLNAGEGGSRAVEGRNKQQKKYENHVTRTSLYSHQQTCLRPSRVSQPWAGEKRNDGSGKKNTNESSLPVVLHKSERLG